MPCCLHCAHAPPAGSRYCNQCGWPLAASIPPAEQRWIFVDLPQVEEAAFLLTAEGRAALEAQLCERFAPFADDGWEWVVHPAAPEFAGWVLRECSGCREIVGANLLCRRVPKGAQPTTAPNPPHRVGAYRHQQLSCGVERVDLPPDRLRPARRQKVPERIYNHGQRCC